MSEDQSQKVLSGYGLRALGHCEKNKECNKEIIYCTCNCLQCSKQDCFKPGCKKENGCKKVHPYKI